MVTHGKADVDARQYIPGTNKKQRCKDKVSKDKLSTTDVNPL
jgi:hypothetical protein